MKTRFLLFFMAFCLMASGKTYYVATPSNGGSDNNNGTLASPFATWQRGFQALTNPGDTLFIRGGIYNLNKHLYLTSSIGGQGTKTNPVIVSNYPGESPVLDCDNLNAESGWDISGKNFWQFIGLTVRHVYQDGQAVKVSAIGVSGCNNVHFINCISHDNGGSGFIFGSNDTVYIRNCDSYNNCDSLGEPGGELGGKADGFQMYCYDCTTDTDGWQMTYFDKCRAWNNSDDGWDFLRNTKAVVDSCWAIYNGYPLNGSGQGMKAGLPDQDPPSSQYIFTYNLSVYNAHGGFRDNCNNQLYHIDSRWYNNTAAFNAGAGFQSSINPLAKMNTNIMRNNISFSNPSPYYFEDISIWTQDHNSWNPGINLTNADFISVDSTGITGPRKPDGSLPDLNFLKLAQTSECINAGTNIGLPFSGTNPDLGCYEFSSSLTMPSIPVINSVAIENATPSRLDMIFSVTLANIVPAASAFSVMVNSSQRAVNSVAVSGTRVSLTLSSPVVYGDIVTVAYTKPASNPIQTSSGGQAASFSAYSVKNNVAATIPVYVSSVVENATPTRLDMTYSLNLANIVPATSAFSVIVNSAARSVSSVAISGTKVLLTISSPVVYGDVVTVAYTKPATNPLQTTSGGQVTSMSSQSVVNNCTVPDNQPPVVSLSSPTKSSSYIAPATITIDATASDPDGSISKVEFYQGTVKIGERTSLPYSFTWKEVPEGNYLITAVATDNYNLKATSIAVSVVVEKSADATNMLPVVTITTPNKGKKYKKNDKVNIEAVATDPDGSITKVEFKSGSVILAELTSSPYVYTWDASEVGNSVITVIATDNLGATSSENLDLFVGPLVEMNSDNINIYPNPNDGHFKIEINPEISESDYSIRIVDLAGKTIYHQKMTGQESSGEFDLSYSPAGAYIVMVTSDNSIQTTKKFIKR